MLRTAANFLDVNRGHWVRIVGGGCLVGGKSFSFRVKYMLADARAR